MRIAPTMPANKGSRLLFSVPRTTAFLAAILSWLLFLLFLDIITIPFKLVSVQLSEHRVTIISNNKGFFRVWMPLCSNFYSLSWSGKMDPFSSYQNVAIAPMCFSSRYRYLNAAMQAFTFSRTIESDKMDYTSWIGCRQNPAAGEHQMRKDTF